MLIAILTAQRENISRSAGAAGTALPLLACSTWPWATLGLTPAAASVSAPLILENGELNN